MADALRMDLITTDLAMYEACNSLLKLATLLRTIAFEDAADVGKALKDVTARNVIQTVNSTHFGFLAYAQHSPQGKAHIL